MKSTRLTLALPLLGALALPLAAQQAPQNLTEPQPTQNGGVTGSNPNTDVSPQQPRQPLKGPGEILGKPDRSTPVGATITGSLDTTHAVSTIQGQEFNGRDELLREIQQRENYADQQVHALRDKATNLSASDKQALDTAWSDYQKSKERLDRAIEQGRQANQKSWDAARTAIAAEYGFFASAVGSIEVAAPN